MSFHLVAVPRASRATLAMVMPPGVTVKIRKPPARDTGASAGGGVGRVGMLTGAIEGAIGALPGVDAGGAIGGVAEVGGLGEAGGAGGIAGAGAGGLGLTSSLALAGCTPVEIHGGTST